MPAVHLVDGDTEPLSRYSMLKVGGKETIVVADENLRGHSRPGVESHGFPNGVPDCAFAGVSAARASSSGTSWRKTTIVSSSVSADGPFHGTDGGSLFLLRDLNLMTVGIRRLYICPPGLLNRISYVHAPRAQLPEGRLDVVTRERQICALPRLLIERCGARKDH
jgi:hypothetical protein